MNSPIERMIDQATGFNREEFLKKTVLLRCPQCSRELRVARDKTDLPGTAVVVAHCDKCDGEDNGVYPEYYRADGTQILGG